MKQWSTARIDVTLAARGTPFEDDLYDLLVRSVEQNAELRTLSSNRPYTITSIGREGVYVSAVGCRSGDGVRLWSGHIVLRVPAFIS
jgi:hypothetical protein